MGYYGDIMRAMWTYNGIPWDKIYKSRWEDDWWVDYRWMIAFNLMIHHDINPGLIDPIFLINRSGSDFNMWEEPPNQVINSSRPLDLMCMCIYIYIHICIYIIYPLIKTTFCPVMFDCKRNRPNRPTLFSILSINHTREGLLRIGCPRNWLLFIMLPCTGDIWGLPHFWTSPCKKIH